MPVPVLITAPVVSGPAGVNSLLICTTGTWTNSPTSYEFIWLRNGAVITGATASTYLTVPADGGTSVNCAVGAINASGESSPGFSNSLAIGSVVVVSSKYGLGHYGLGHYSRTSLPGLAGGITPSVSFIGDFDIIGQVFIAGRLTPAIALAGDLSMMVGTITGNVAPQVTFGGDLGVIFGLAGGIVPQVTLGALLAFDLNLQGNIAPVVTPAVSDKFTSGPLWAPIESCGPVEWKEVEVCRG